MRIPCVLKLVIIVLIAISPTWAAFETAPGYRAEVLHSTGIIGGITLDAGSLYFGTGTEIKSLDLHAGNALSTNGVLPANVEIPVVLRHEGVTHTALTGSYTAPYQMGAIAAGTFQARLNIEGLYSAAMNDQGECYLVANPDGNGSKIFQYDLASGEATEIANVGGYSGGLTFDSSGNLYYADQGVWGVRDASVIQFTFADLTGAPTSGVLNADDATSVLSIAAGSIGFDGSDNFFATTGWGATLSQYDLASGTQVAQIATGGIGQFVIDGETIYAVDTDWGTYSSTIQEITPVPEPATMALLAVGGLGLLRSRRRIR